MADHDGNRVIRQRSFRGQVLDGTDFSGQDLRGVDFTGASLRGADFRDSTLGVPLRAGIVVLALAIIAAVIAGVGIGWGVDVLRDRFSADEWDRVAEGATLATTLVVLVVVIIWRGFDVAFKAVVVLYPALLVINVVANAIWEEVEYAAIVKATALLVLLVVAIVAGILGRVVGGVFGAWSIALVALIGGLATGRAQGGLAGLVVALSLVVISKRALRGDTRDRTLRRLAHRFIRRWGTQFVDADLTATDFTGADASRCDVRRATLDSVTWDPDYPPPVDLELATTG